MVTISASLMSIEMEAEMRQEEHRYIYGIIWKISYQFNRNNMKKEDIN